MTDQIDEKPAARIYDGEAVRDGTGPLDNLVVLAWWLGMMVVIGVILISYFMFRD